MCPATRQCQRLFTDPRSTGLLSDVFRGRSGQARASLSAASRAAHLRHAGPESAAPTRCRSGRWTARAGGWLSIKRQMSRAGAARQNEPGHRQGVGRELPAGASDCCRCVLATDGTPVSNLGWNCVHLQREVANQAAGGSQLHRRGAGKQRPGPPVQLQVHALTTLPAHPAQGDTQAQSTHRSNLVAPEERSGQVGRGGMPWLDAEGQCGSAEGRRWPLAVTQLLRLLALATP